MKCLAITRRDNTENRPLVRPPIPVSEEYINGEKLIRPPDPDTEDASNEYTRGLAIDSSEDYPDITLVNEGSKENESLNEEENDQVKGIHKLH